MKHHTRILLLIGCATVAQAAAHAADSLAPATASVTAVFRLPSVNLAKLGSQPFTDADLKRAKENGLTLADLPSIGSGLAKVGENEFVGITDRGPNGTVEVKGKEQRTFPLPKFCPSIVRFKLVEGQVQIVKTILLTGSDNKPLTGLSNSEGEGRLFESAKAKSPLPYNPSGIDPEAIRIFPDGKFLISEEYSPSVLVVSASGQVLVRYTPATKPLAGASYPVKPILSSVLAQRRDNRGLESLALSPDGKTAFVMLQSPAGDEDDKKFKQASVSRTIRLDLTDPLNARVTGHFLMPLGPTSAYGKDQKPAGLKLNDAEWLAPDKLLVLEQGKDAARLLVADFSEATNLLGRDDENSLAFEAAISDSSTLSVKPARTEVLLSTSEMSPVKSTKLEGLAVISPTEIALANDNDFGLGDNKTGEPSTIWLLQMNRPMPLTR